MILHRGKFPEQSDSAYCGFCSQTCRAHTYLQRLLAGGIMKRLRIRLKKKITVAEIK